MRLYSRVVIFGAVVLVVRVATALVLHFMHVDIADLTPATSQEDKESSAAAFARLQDAFALLRRLGPRTVSGSPTGFGT